MSKEKLFEQTKTDQQIGTLEAIKEGVQAIAPGLSLSKILGDIVHELKEQAQHGEAERKSTVASPPLGTQPADSSNHCQRCQAQAAGGGGEHAAPHHQP